MSAGVAPDDPLDYTDGIEVFDDDPDFDELIAAAEDVCIKRDEGIDQALVNAIDRLGNACRPRSEK